MTSKEYLILALITLLAVIILADLYAPKYTSSEHFKVLNEIIGATASGILLTISNYFSNDKK